MSGHRITVGIGGQTGYHRRRALSFRKLGLFSSLLLAAVLAGFSLPANQTTTTGDDMAHSGFVHCGSAAAELALVPSQHASEACILAEDIKSSGGSTDDKAGQSPGGLRSRKRQRLKQPSRDQSAASGTDKPAGERPQDTASGAARVQFVRLVERKGEPQFLQTAIVSYRPTASPSEGPASETGGTEQSLPPDLQIDLVGVIHIAEQSYYERLNRLLRNYDVVLYELVAPEGTRVQPGTRSSHPISAIQVSAKDFLGLAFQLDVIDYQRENFVHADMSPEEFSQAMKERGESVWAIFFRAFGYGLARSQSRQDRSDEGDFLAALFSKDRQLQMKRLFARQLAEDVEGQIRVLEGPEGSTLISGRNDKVLQVLQKQIAAGHRRIAIFYGAGHMFHFHRRLLELGLTPTKTRWLNAWDLRATAASETEKVKTP